MGAAGIVEQGAESVCGIEVAGGVAKERFKTKSGVVDPARQAEKGVSSLSRIVTRIASVRCWDNCSGYGRKRNANEYEWDKKESKPQGGRVG